MGHCPIARLLHTYFSIDTKNCGTRGTSIWRQRAETVVAPDWGSSLGQRAIAERSDKLTRISTSGLGGPTLEHVDRSFLGHCDSPAFKETRALIRATDKGSPALDRAFWLLQRECHRYSRVGSDARHVAGLPGHPNQDADARTRRTTCQPPSPRPTSFHARLVCRLSAIMGHGRGQVNWDGSVLTTKPERIST